MAAWYEQTLSTKLEPTGEEETTPPTPTSSFNSPESRISQTDRGTRRTQMKELLESWLSEVDDEREDDDKNYNDTEEKADIITSRKIILEVESTRPNVLLA